MDFLVINQGFYQMGYANYIEQVLIILQDLVYKMIIK
jgi:hypothetical protein